MFSALREHSSGDTLDVGGGEFFSAARKRRISFGKWITLEPCKPQRKSEAVHVCGDGQKIPFRTNCFETALCIHVVEHVIDPLAVLSEIARVLQPGGKLVLMYPQTAGLHMAPGNYYNFTSYFAGKALDRCGMKVIEHQKLGGVWSTTASRMVYFWLKLCNVRGYTDTEFRKSRPKAFFLLLPLMIPVSLLIFGASLLLSIGDLSEEANNHLVVAVKK